MVVNRDSKTGLNYLSIKGNEAQGVSVIITSDKDIDCDRHKYNGKHDEQDNGTCFAFLTTFRRFGAKLLFEHQPHQREKLCHTPYASVGLSSTGVAVTVRKIFSKDTLGLSRILSSVSTATIRP